MKIRADFVTNSSSSSFILRFKSNESIPDELQEGFCMPEERGFYERVLEDVENPVESFKDEEAVLKYIEDWVQYSIKWDLLEDKFGYWYGRNREEEDAYLQSEEFKEKYAQRMDKIKDEVREKLAGGTIYRLVSYEDHTRPESMLEHEFMPDHPCTAYVINNH